MRHFGFSVRFDCASTITNFPNRKMLVGSIELFMVGICLKVTVVFKLFDVCIDLLGICIKHTQIQLRSDQDQDVTLSFNARLYFIHRRHPKNFF